MSSSEIYKDRKNWRDTERVKGNKEKETKRHNRIKDKHAYSSGGGTSGGGTSGGCGGGTGS